MSIALHSMKDRTSIDVRKRQAEMVGLDVPAYQSTLHNDVQLTLSINKKGCGSFSSQWRNITVRTRFDFVSIRLNYI